MRKKAKDALLWILAISYIAMIVWNIYITYFPTRYCKDTIEVVCGIYTDDSMCCSLTDQGKFYFMPSYNGTLIGLGRCEYSLTNETYLSCKKLNISR